MTAFEEGTDLTTPWSLQVTRTGFGVGSLWDGTGSSRVTETSNTAGPTVTCAGSTVIHHRSRVFLRMKYICVTGGGNT